MRINHFLTEANVASKIKDPGLIKQVYLAMRHDPTLPAHQVAKLGPKPTPEQTMQLWSDLLDQSLSHTQYGDISRDGKFDQWLTRLYTQGHAEYEDINGEGGDALGAWAALSKRRLLEPADQDFNKFRNLKQLQTVIGKRNYREELQKIRNQAEIEKHKREKKDIILVNNDRYLVVLPLNYGSCYTFNNSEGIQANFCTGSSQGLQWFNRYAPNGPVISILDKQNANEVNGKWQIHAPTNQIKNSNQRINDAATFGKLFPGLMKEIVHGLETHAEQINAESQDIVRGGYDVNKAIQELERTFPAAFTDPKQPRTDEEIEGLKAIVETMRRQFADFEEGQDHGPYGAGIVPGDVDIKDNEIFFTLDKPPNWPEEQWRIPSIVPSDMVQDWKSRYDTNGYEVFGLRNKTTGRIRIGLREV
jgi:hypothetical protein